MKKKSLTYYRELADLTPEQLAKKIGVTKRTILYWESDKELLKGARVKNIVKLCKVLKISINDII